MTLKKKKTTKVLFTIEVDALEKLDVIRKKHDVTRTKLLQHILSEYLNANKGSVNGSPEKEKGGLNE